MVVLFMLFPRLAPLWGVPGDAMVGRSGLSANMQMGTIASLALDSSVAMRIKFEGTPPPQRDLYFRGPVLSSFDGREWRPLRQLLSPLPPAAVDLKVESPAVRYQVTLEPSNRPWILVLEATPDKPDLKGFAPSMNSELQWLAERPFNDLVRYTATSHPQFRYGPLKRVAGLQNDINLPEGFNPRTLTLAAEIRRASNTTATQVLVDAALTRLRTGGYVYTLEPGVFGRDTADEFWFDRKQGFCEHIASSFVVLMRGMNVPARVVTGYQGGELNALDGFWTVRQSDAHAWAEVWMEGRGWVRVDPTAAVAPTRTGTLQRLEAPRSIFNQALVTMNPAFALNLRAFWEATNNRWNQWVLNYSQSRQLDLLRKIGFESPGWEDLSYVLIAIIVSAALVGALWTQWERSRQDPWLRLYHDAQRRSIRAGLAVTSTMPPRQMAELLGKVTTGDRTQIATLQEWLLALEAVRYAPSSLAKPQTLKKLQRDLKRLHWISTIQSQ